VLDHEKRTKKKRKIKAKTTEQVPFSGLERGNV
jgi:hypothetical protein